MANWMSMLTTAFLTFLVRFPVIPTLPSTIASCLHLGGACPPPPPQLHGPVKDLLDLEEQFLAEIEGGEGVGSGPTVRAW